MEGGFFTTEPLGKPSDTHINENESDREGQRGSGVPLNPIEHINISHMARQVTMIVENQFLHFPIHWGTTYLILSINTQVSIFLRLLVTGISR